MSHGMKDKLVDAGAIISGGFYTAISDALPILIGLATVALLIMRIVATYHESQMRKLELDKMKKEVGDGEIK